MLVKIENWGYQLLWVVGGVHPFCILIGRAEASAILEADRVDHRPIQHHQDSPVDVERFKLALLDGG